MINVQIVEDKISYAQLIEFWLNRSDFARVSRCYNDPQSCREALCVRENLPDILLLDAHFPKELGTTLSKELLKKHPKLKIIFLTERDEPSMIQRIIALGIRGFMLKSSPLAEITDCIKTVNAYKDTYEADEKREVYICEHARMIIAGALKPQFLTRTEEKILHYVVAGYPDTLTGKVLNIRPDGVTEHISNMLLKFDVPNRTVLGVMAKEALLVVDDRITKLKKELGRLQRERRAEKAAAADAVKRKSSKTK